MNVTFDSSQEHTWPNDDVSFGFWVDNPTGRGVRCAYRLEGSGAVTVSRWRVDAPTRLAGGERSHGELHVRVPKNHGSDPLTVAMQLRVSTDDPDVIAEDTCTLVVRPARFAVRPEVSPSRDGVAARLSLLMHGRSKVDAEVELGHKGG